MNRSLFEISMAIILVAGAASTGLAQQAETDTPKESVTDGVTTADPQVEKSSPNETPSTDADAKPGDPDTPEDSPADPEESASEDSVSDEEFLQDPFSFLQSDMQSAVVDLKDGVTKPPAEVTQPRILKGFGLLIEQLERQGQGAGRAGQRATRPAQQSSLKPGPGGQNEMRAPRDDGRDWADLTPQERQKILQSKTDGFPAGYDEILADYFRRVARAQEAASSKSVEGELTDSVNEAGTN